MNDYTMAPCVSSGEREAHAETHDAWYTAGVRHLTISDQEPNSRPFPFLKLPAETRNQIYRLALLTSNTTTDIPTADNACETLGVDLTLTNEVSVGSVRCKSSRTYTLGYQVSILRVNKMIHRESWGIFNLENFWAVVQVNKVGFGKEMKEHGFPVAIGDNLWHRIKHPVVKVTVIFSGLSDQVQSENFVLATVHLNGLIRALWTAEGASEMEVNIHFQPRLTFNQPSERELLEPFLKLRNIKRVALSMDGHNYSDLYPGVYTPSDDINLTIDEVKESIRCLQRYIQEGQWEQALSQAKEHSALLSDSMTVYGLRLLGIEARLDINTASARNNAAREITVLTSLAFGEIALNLQKYSVAIHYASQNLHICRVTIFHVLPGHNAVPLSSHHCLSLLLRASGYIGLNQSEAALDDIKKVRESMPDSPELASVSNAWQEAFGLFPDSANTPVAS